MFSCSLIWISTTPYYYSLLFRRRCVCLITQPLRHLDTQRVNHKIWSRKSSVLNTHRGVQMPSQAILCCITGFFKKISSQTCSGRIRSFSPRSSLHRLDIDSRENFFCLASLNSNYEAETKMRPKKRQFMLCKICFRLVDRVEAGRAKNFSLESMSNLGGLLQGKMKAIYSHKSENWFFEKVHVRD